VNIYNCNNYFGSCQGCSWESLIAHDNMGTHTYEFNNTREKRKDIVSYLDTESAVCVLVFFNVDKKKNEKFLEDYKVPFVKSFKYLGNNPEKAKNLFETLTEKDDKQL